MLEEELEVVLELDETLEDDVATDELELRSDELLDLLTTELDELFTDDTRLELKALLEIDDFELIDEELVVFDELADEFPPAQVGLMKLPS